MKKLTMRTKYIEMVKRSMAACELIEAHYPELTNTMVYNQVNIYRAEGINRETLTRYNKQTFLNLIDELTAEVLKAAAK